MSRRLLPSTPGIANTEPSAEVVDMANAQLLAQPSELPPGGSGGGDHGLGSTPPNRPTYSKRGKITIVACVPCRKRKTKCDGQRPSCSQCASRRQGCFYDMTDDQRKLTHLRENVEHLQEKSDSLSSLLHTIQNASDEEAHEVFRRLRSRQNLQVVADQVQASHLLSGVSGSPGKVDATRPEAHTGSHVPPESIGGRHLDFERLVRLLALADADLSTDIVRRIQDHEEISSILSHVSQGAPQFHLVQQAMQQNMPASLINNYSQPDQAFGMVKGAQILPSHAVHGQSSEFTIDSWRRPWTNVTQNENLLEHLIELYFTWQHSFFQSFPEKLFRADMAAGRTKYCSAMLVNIICACGCFFSDRSAAKIDRGDGKTLMDSFYEESKELLHRDESSNLTTVATLNLLSYIEGTKGRITSLWLHTGRSSLMATDINLHLRRTNSPAGAHEDEQERANESKARTHAFWGSFHSDATSAFTLGRLPNYNINGITAELPIVDPTEDEEMWSPFEIEVPHRPSARSSTFLHCATLSEIINASLLMFFAPTSSLSGSLLMGQYEKYLEWKRSLPSVLAVTDQCPPHVISLHLYYHTAVLLLFRPFMKANIVNNPDVVPRDICRQSANDISSLFSLHVKLFGQAGICMFQVHCLLTACTIHIINLPSISATREFTAACNHFSRLVQRNDWARSSLKILRGLVERWSLILPQEAEAALYCQLSGDEEGDRGTTGSGSLGISPTPPGFALPADPASAYEPKGPSIITDAISQTSNSETHPSNVDPALSNQGQPPPKRQRIMANQSQTGARSLSDEGHFQGEGRTSQPAPENYLYSPLANQPAPFLVPVRPQRQAGTSLQQRKPSSYHPPKRQESQAAGNHGSDDDREKNPEDDRSGAAAAADEEVKSEQPGVEGLSFGDDWRDPFLGFESSGDTEGQWGFS